MAKYEIGFSLNAAGHIYPHMKDPINKALAFVKAFRQQHFGKRQRIQRTYYRTERDVIKYMAVRAHMVPHYEPVFTFAGHKGLLKNWIVTRGAVPITMPPVQDNHVFIRNNNEGGYIIELLPSTLLPDCPMMRAKENEEAYEIINNLIPEPYEQEIIFNPMIGYKDTLSPKPQ